MNGVAKFLRERLRRKMHAGSKLALGMLLWFAALGLFSPPIGGMNSLDSILICVAITVVFAYAAGYLLWWVVFKPILMVWEWYWKPWD